MIIHHHISTPLTAIAGVLFVAALLQTGSAQAGPHGPHAFLKAPTHIVAYDPLWKLKNPGGPVELNPQPEPPGRYIRTFGLTDPGARVGFNPQPDPPGFN